MKIAWPNDKVILDELSESPDGANNNGSEVIADLTSLTWKVNDYITNIG